MFRLNKYFFEINSCSNSLAMYNVEQIFFNVTTVFHETWTRILPNGYDNCLLDIDIH